jgi:hypothetical protein
MDRLLPWRGTLVQLVLMGALLYFAKIAPEMHVPIMTTLAGLGAMLTQRARTQAGSEGPGNPTGTDVSSYPPAMIRRKGDGSSTPPGALRILMGAAWASFVMIAMLVLVPACNQTPAQVASDISAGVVIAKEVCTEVGIATGDPLVTLICPLLDRSQDGGTSADGGPGRMITVVMPRSQWLAIKARSDAGP